ncbi:MAG: LacI family transcriptional regulator [Clostridiales bacterium]|nr:LacI family transcriptional regulator [Clostridiales bacterium]
MVYNTRDKQLSVKTIAEMAGVSVATVSRVINQNGRFSAETEKRVKDIIKQFDYQPNQLARGLRVSKTRVIGILVPDITNEFFSRITLKIQQALYAYNYATIVCNTNETAEIEIQHMKMLKSQRVSGLIYISGGICGDFFYPTVFIDRRPSNEDLDATCVFIESDNRMGGYIAAKELLKNGCKKIAFIRFKDNISSHEERLVGYRQAIEEAGMTHDPNLIIYAKNVSLEEGAAASDALFSRNPDTDGVFCSTDLLAVGVIKRLNEKGWNVPRQVKVIGFDNISIANVIHPSLTTVHQDIDSFASLSVNALMSMIDGEPVKQNVYTVPVKLITRESTRI